MATTFEIHPAFGVARVGTSDEFFIGPEPGVAPPAKYRDGTGRLKRQAARFRVYKCERDAAGVLTSATEVKPADGSITWTVHVVNLKGANKRFLGSGQRNGAAPNNDAANAALIIEPGPRTFAGPNQPVKVFDGGKFKGTPVPLGAALTDADGRLIVMGAGGMSDSVPPQSSPGAPGLGNFADNDGWFDDVADGPVKATVQLTGQAPVEAVSAWVLVGPPDYAPPVTNLITLYDIGMQVAVDKGWLTAPTTPSFTRDIQPILQRAVGYQWVNRAARRATRAGRRATSPATGPHWRTPPPVPVSRRGSWSGSAIHGRRRYPTRRSGAVCSGCRACMTRPTAKRCRH